MCINSTELNPSGFYHSAAQRQQSKRSKVQVHRLTRRKRWCEEKMEKEMEMEMEMEMENLKLYLENRSIIEENEKLRKKAILLHQENLALMSELQKKFSHDDPPHHFSPMLTD